MNRRIFKYPLLAEDLQTVHLPRDAQLLALQVQHEQPCIWALVDADAPTEPWHIRIIGTGHPVDEPDMPYASALGGYYLGTFQLEGGALVFHAFRVSRGTRGPER